MTALSERYRRFERWYLRGLWQVVGVLSLLGYGLMPIGAGWLLWHVTQSLVLGIVAGLVAALLIAPIVAFMIRHWPTD